MSFNSPAVALSLDRRDFFQVLVSLSQGPPQLVDFHHGTAEPVPTISLGEAIISFSAPTPLSHVPQSHNDQHDTKRGISQLPFCADCVCMMVRSNVVPMAAEAEGKKAKGSNVPVHAVALLDRDGSRIFIGQARGLLSVVDRESLQFLDALKVPPRPRLYGLTLPIQTKQKAKDTQGCTVAATGFHGR